MRLLQVGATALAVGALWRFLLAWLIAFVVIGVFVIPTVEHGWRFTNRQVHIRMAVSAALGLLAALLYLRF